MAALLDRFWGLFDRFLGVSKTTFFATRVVPANPNDAYYGNRCSFCWGEYDDTHEGVRVLPCNHVFGRDCLQDLINSPNGHVCPICRCTWYRIPWTWTDLRRWIVMQHFHLTQQLHGYYDSLPPYIKAPLSLAGKLTEFMFNSDDPYYWADMIVSRWTNLYARNPDLNVWLPQKSMDKFYMLKAIILPFVYASRLLEAESIVYVCTACSVLSGFARYLLNPSGGCNNTKDACALALILLVSSVIAHLTEFWTLLYISNYVLDLNGGLRRFLVGALVL